MNPVGVAVELVGGPSKLAALLGVSPQAVIFWRDGKREPPVRIGASLERLTDGRVPRWAFRPHDWHVIWPELIGSAGAPAVPTGPTQRAAQAA
jgi:DNA-binding transcriptional regulator YdaS (Cro superfamily)